MATYWENSCSFGLRYVSWCGCLIVSLVFSHLGFWSGNLFLIAPFPDLCLLVPFQRIKPLYFIYVKCILVFFYLQHWNHNYLLLIHAISTPVMTFRLTEHTSRLPQGDFINPFHPYCTPRMCRFFEEGVIYNN